MTPRRRQLLQRGIHRGAVLLASLLLAACASKPPAPDWQVNAYAALKGYSSAYLSGNARVAEFEWARARSEIAATGRADLLARAELTRCAVRAASLEFDDCAGYQPLAPDAAAPEQAYAAFLSGRWEQINSELLPEHYRALLARPAAGAASGATGALGTVQEPLARLVAAAALLQRTDLSPADIALATQTASDQGWRRPLLAWLGLQRQRASAAGDADAAARIQRRIDLVLQTQHGSPDSQH